MNIEKWNFHPSLGEERIKQLLNPLSYKEIFEKLEGEMEILCGHPEDEQKFKSGAFRYRYCVLISENTFDIFFNSINGYRSWFFRSEEEGIEKNKELISILTPALLEKYNIPGHTNEQIAQSFQLNSSKVWLAEKGKQICEHCVGEWSKPTDTLVEIQNDQWGKSQDTQGCKAYRFKKLFIFSGFRFPDGKEYIPADKKERAKQIMETGWAGL
jgi:hypothetical protein